MKTNEKLYNSLSFVSMLLFFCVLVLITAYFEENQLKRNHELQIYKLSIIEKQIKEGKSFDIVIKD